jgi:hypothetical protein
MPLEITEGKRWIMITDKNGVECSIFIGMGMDAHRIEIDVDQAQQIIAHLQKQFEL